MVHAVSYSHSKYYTYWKCIIIFQKHPLTIFISTCNNHTTDCLISHSISYPHLLSYTFRFQSHIHIYCHRHFTFNLISTSTFIYISLSISYPHLLSYTFCFQSHIHIYCHRHFTFNLILTESHTFHNVFPWMQFAFGCYNKPCLTVVIVTLQEG